MRLRVGVSVFQPTLGYNSSDRDVYSPTTRLCRSTCNWAGERMDIWCRDSCFNQEGWQLRVVLFHQSEYVENTVVGIARMPLSDLTNPDLKRHTPHIYPMRFDEAAQGGRGKLTCFISVGESQAVSFDSGEQLESSNNNSILEKFIIGVGV